MVPAAAALAQELASVEVLPVPSQRPGGRGQGDLAGGTSTEATLRELTGDFNCAVLANEHDCVEHVDIPGDVSV